MKDWILGSILGGVVVCVLLILLLSGGDEQSYEPLRDLKLPVRLVPAPLASVSATPSPDVPRLARRDAQKKALRIYLDVSEPMAGYLQSGASPGRPALRAVTLLVPDHLLRVYGPIDSVDWVTVGETLRSLPDEPGFTPGEFDGAETYLDLALRQGSRLLATGEIEAFALVTDLVATREVSGALGLYNALRAWLSSPAVLHGEIDLGLLGVRVPFSGVANGKCGVPGAGCWYSERGRRWVVVDKPVDRPLYVLILGRAGPLGRATTGEESRVRRSGEALLEDVGGLGLEGRWELLTRFSRGGSGSLTCTASREDGAAQFALLRDGTGRYLCQRDEPVRLACRLSSGFGDAPGGGRIGFRPKAASLSWEESLATAEVVDEELVVTIDCKAVRRAQPEGPLRVTGLEVEPDPASVAGDWAGWSVESDERPEQLDRTLQLRHFIGGTRPERFSAEVGRDLLAGRR